MTERTIYITQNDLAKLKQLLDNPVLKQEKNALRNLVGELQRAVIVPAREIPADVVTMRSRVNMKDNKTGEQSTVTLVFPSEADLNEGKISVLAPIGTALLGYRIGDIVTWKVPAGEKEIVITGIEYQPEASGDFHL